MKQKYYSFESDTANLTFTFESKSEERVVQKLVEFASIQDETYDFQGETYNLAFGDVDENGGLDDLGVTNNKDME